MGQYTQVDPIGLAGGNPTLYGYVFNPFLDIDPFGLTVTLAKCDTSTPVIGKMPDLNHIGPNEFRVADLLPDLGSPRANWYQNSSVLRSVMRRSSRIRDASPFPMNNAGFLGAERNLLQNQGWIYRNGFWFPGGGI